ncbi:hypothetical protein [Lactiplantibacillus plajomi]|uniref:Uncharacterized protein n=1 Tax=Lactiplantibacillus plajomi TaxID=1457217 RepID=A0ABV6K3I0_9LACO|nr:hypothetical protein [Lactiplantibacillus plajomi]
MVTQTVATILLLAVFMIAFVYYLNSLFLGRNEKHAQPTKKHADHQNDQRDSH